MNADRLLELYEQISDASDAIARLRDVVLEVGVRGKLNEQDEAETVSPEFLNETTDPEFPANWRTLNFGKYCNIEGGNQPPKSQFVDSPRDGYVRLFQIRDLGERPVPVFIPETSTKRFSVDGEILIGRYGASVGKVFWAQNGAYNVALAKFIFPENAFLPDFAFRLLKSSFFQKALEGASRTAQAGFNKGDLAHIAFPLPPLAEQHRIVAKVDELMALCDQLEQARAGREAVRDRLTTASLARLTAPETDVETFQSHAHFALQSLPTLTTRPDQIKTLRQTILNLAVRGELVAQDPSDEPAVELLKRIADERISGKALRKSKRKDLQDAEEVADSEPVPHGWVWARLRDLALEMRYGTSVKCDYDIEGVPVLRIPNVSGGRISLDDMKLGPLSPKEVADLSLQAGDLLMIRSNGSLDIVGRAAVVTSEAVGMSFAGYLVRLRTAPSAIDPHYVWLATNSSEVRDQIERPIRSAVGLKNVNLTEFGALAFRLPPLAEQHRIVARVDALMALCDQLEASLTTTATTRSKLLNALLYEALSPNAEAAQ